MSEKPSFIIRRMLKSDLKEAISLGFSEGWNQTEKDWMLMLDNPLNICIVAEHNNKIAGTATAFTYDKDIAWIGMVLVDKSLRGQGAGKMLLKYLIDNLQHIESVKLDATPAGQPLYANLGFIEEYKIFRMTNTSVKDFTPVPVLNETTKTEYQNLPEIIEKDKDAFGTDRSYLLNRLYKNFPQKAFIVKINQNVDGYIFGRDGARFHYIGPAYCSGTSIAISLISRTLQSLKDQSVALDVPEDKEELISWLESVGFVKQRHFVRMYLKSNRFKGLAEKQYLISGPEFG
jgi:ribosomal protein S18 acetylase RimI-like enzyme